MGSVQFNASFKALDDAGNPIALEQSCAMTRTIVGDVLASQKTDIPHSTTVTLFDLTDSPNSGVMASFKALAIKVQSANEDKLILELTADEVTSGGDRVMYLNLYSGQLFTLMAGGSFDLDSNNFDADPTTIYKARIRNTDTSKTATVSWVAVN